MRFTKMQGIGNDYIYVNCFEEVVHDPARLALVMSRPHFGVGAGRPGAYFAPSDTADFAMRIFNADGSEAEMCGNASRCIGKYVYERGLTRKTELTLETKGGLKQLWLTVENGKVSRVLGGYGHAGTEPAEYPGEFCREKSCCATGCKFWDRPGLSPA